MTINAKEIITLGEIIFFKHFWLVSSCSVDYMQIGKYIFEICYENLWGKTYSFCEGQNCMYSCHSYMIILFKDFIKHMYDKSNFTVKIFFVFNISNMDIKYLFYINFTFQKQEFFAIDLGQDPSWLMKIWNWHILSTSKLEG